MNGMRKLLFILMVLPFTLNVRAEDPPSMLEKAVSNIKRWEGWHRGKMPYIGFGHRLLPHEKLTENLSEAQADSLLRCDLERCLKVFRKNWKVATGIFTGNIYRSAVIRGKSFQA